MRTKTQIKEYFSHGIPFPSDGRLHFVGVGGAGMSAIARIFISQNRDVSGSDAYESESLKMLRLEGVDARVGHNLDLIKGSAAVIVSDAISLDDPEINEAVKLNIPLYRRSQALAELLKDYKVIAITGSHGKSTTTAMLAKILQDAGLDPLVVVGAEVISYGSNVRLGYGKYAVVEACEAYESYNDLDVETVVLTNLEPEHLDYHETWDNLLQSVINFTKRATGSPKIVFSLESAGSKEVAVIVGDSIGFGFDNPEFRSEYTDGFLRTSIGEFRFLQPGKHNALNALAAVETAVLLGIDRKFSLESVSKFRGIKRRLEYFGNYQGIDVYDDYAHHPTEINASIKALREQHPNQRLTVVFQPHLYTRTKHLLKEFVRELSQADILFITDIYPAREEPIAGVSSAVICEQLEKQGKEVHYVPSRHLLPRTVENHAIQGDVVVGMGAGTIESFAKDFIDELQRRSQPLRVLVLYGGSSAEREVSILSGLNVAGALKRKGYDVALCDPVDSALGKGDLHLFRSKNRPDIVFPLLHGTGSEDGAIQGFLETFQLPYVGSGIGPSSLAVDKFKTKRHLAELGVPVPEGVLLRQGDAIPENITYPVVVKPNSQGSTIGLGFANNIEELKRCVEIARKYDSDVLIEEKLDGIEISVSVVGEKVLPVVEICPKSGIYDFYSKYTVDATEEIVPARISHAATKTAQEYALLIHKTLRLQDFSRTDIIVKGEKVYVLEVNTIPGMTKTSLLPKAAQGAGITYDDLCEMILGSALNRYGIKK